MVPFYNTNVQWHRRRGIPGWGNFTNKAMQGGGPLIDIGAHMLDCALYLLGYPQISYVCASSSDRIGKKRRPGPYGEHGTVDALPWRTDSLGLYILLMEPV